MSNIFLSLSKLRPSGRTLDIANNFNVSRKSVQRYIRLTYLNNQLLDLVDEKILPVKVGVNLSYLKDFEQEILVEYLAVKNKEITIDISEKLKEFSSERELTLSDIFNIASPPKKEKKAKDKSKGITIKFSEDELNDYFRGMEELEIKAQIILIISQEYIKDVLEKNNADIN